MSFPYPPMLTLTQVWGALLLFTLCPLLGALPLTGWITQILTGKRLTDLGTGNVGISAAFYHGGPVAGVPSVLAEAGKGIGAVLLARHYFPSDPVWEIVALIGLVMGRYWGAKGAGTTNVVWGFGVHDPITAGLTLLMSFLAFTVVREKHQGRLLALGLMPLLTALRHQDGVRVVAVACLAGLIAWIYEQLPDDLDMPTSEARVESQRMFQFFQGDRALLSLESPLSVAKAGGKGATLAQLKAWGYPVPRGYVLPAGDDPAALIAIAQPSSQQPLVVRSSAVGEDSLEASAAGQYTSVLNITNREDLAVAITRCFSSYNHPSAVEYRRDRGLAEAAMAVIVQQQVTGVYSGVAFSRDPITRAGDAVVIEALPGGAAAVVSGQQTPESYRVWVQADDLPEDVTEADSWRLPEALTLTVEGQGTVPSELLQQVAFLARHLEQRYGGLPQDVEWSFDGEQLWLLQSRSITTLYPLWTRKIAAEVIPGLIRPLTWSINRPLTCGVWGEIFTLVLGSRSRGLDFEKTATLHHSRAYFNASLLGDIFLRMGLPPESLEFLTRGAKFTKPPLSTTIRNLPGLLRLARREWQLPGDFERDRTQLFDPLLTQLQSTPASGLAPDVLLSRIEQILQALKQATYYSILAPLSLALRQGITKAPQTALDGGKNPEVASLKALQDLAQTTRYLLPQTTLDRITDAASLFAVLAELEDGASVLAQFNRFLDEYGYLSEVGTDIAVPTWRENPHPVRELLAQFVLSPPPAVAPDGEPQPSYPGVQKRLDLKGQVTAIYSRLLAELRWSFVALEQRALEVGWLQQPGDIFFLTYDEVHHWVSGNPLPHLGNLLPGNLGITLAARRDRYDQDHALDPVPYLVYGNEPPNLARYVVSPQPSVKTLQGIPASPGQVEGLVKVFRNLQSVAILDAGTILVVPYTDAGWAPLLARAGGIIAEVGGQLSHGAIVAREYGIPAVMNVAEATHYFQDGQRVRLDGTQGTVEIL
ncbi:glycerol-3-phosphate acyltransferase [Leptolyngbya sp. PCC 6406]|uniref:glycerol-3-phosphate acyltransferase n=1 Tax=Leptolyngbya sp. PCC 6406 TaxID=1173264 RepID=UPI0002ACD576|nr:glycerol-3-phosphate acyltransferase [Leptolyngbya sp. PCC 6406]